MQREDKFLNALAEAYRLQEAIIATTELAIISTAVDGTITSFNKAAETLLGYTGEETIGKQSLINFHDATELALRASALSDELSFPVQIGFDAISIKSHLQNVADRREWTYIRKNGTRFPVVVSITALWDEKDKLIGYASIATDITAQKAQELKVRESQEHLQALVSSLDDIVFELDENARFTHIWVKSDEYLFLPRNQIYGRTLTEMFGEAFARPFEKGFQQVLQTGKTFNHEYKTLANDERWFNAKYSLIYDHGLPTTRVSVCIQDITARKQAEISLKESEERFRLLAENISGTIYLCRNDVNYSMLYLNDNAAVLTGYQANEFLSGNIHFSDLFHEGDRERIFKIVDEALEKKVSFHILYRINHKSGVIRWVEETGIGVYSSDGLLLMIEGYLTDVTERILSEEELHRIADENHRIFNYSIGLKAVANFEGYFIKLNPAWERLLGWSVRELTSAKFADFIHPDDLQRTYDTFKYVLDGNDILTFENRYRHKDGSYRWLMWTSSPDRTRGLIYASAVDITDRKKFEDDLLLSKKDLEVAAMELEEQNRQLDEFAHIISHNLRSPAGNIKALLGFINDKSSLEDYKLIFEKVKNVANNLNETMNELMEMLMVKKNTDIERTEIRFKDILDKVVQSLEGDLIQCGATLTFDFNSAPKIIYSKTYLESIFQNLLSNGIKYRSSERKPQIHVSTSIIGNRIELRFADNGLGIDLEKYGAKLFGLHKTFHENKDARGVGLFLTKTQIETMGGSIGAESKPGEGTTFVIRF
ncbi:PAS domain-containing sensor histidine kinase [Pseudochryseolinea flava]|nr:PAS domain S-box protein [Pseudochryseolinea flava]